MLVLVVADGHLVDVVHEHVGGHQHRIGEQAEPHRAVTGRLLLELDHAGRLAEAGHAFQQVVQLGVLGHLRVGDDRGTRRVDAGGEQHAGDLESRRAYLLGVVLHGECVQVGDHRDGVRGALRGHQRAHGAQQVAQVQPAGRLESGEVPGHGRLLELQVTTAHARESRTAAREGAAAMRSCASG
jgi:hypothetical protein